MTDKHEVKGGAKETGGKLKEAAGSLLGDEHMKADGRADQTEGKTEKNVGKVKDAIKDQLR